MLILQSSPASATPGSGGGSWPPGPPYQGPPHGTDYPPGGPSTPNSSQGPPSSSANSKLKDQTPEQAPPQKQVELLSPELRKAGSISSLRDALLATTASTTQSQQYTSYSSPKIEHQASPVTPSGNPMTPESSSVISPQISVTAAARQDSQLLCAGGQGVNQERNCTPYSRQNSAVSGAKDARSNPSQSVVEEGNGPFQVESILGIKSDDSGVKQSSPVSNSLRDGSGGGEGTGSNLNSPHAQLAPNTGMGAQEGGRSPAPGRPDLLGFPARSPTFRGGDKQPSPLTEDGKTVS